jgi:2-haloacid dehalogenase
MTATEIRDVDVCVFDAYGTLFDYASAAMRCKDALAADWMAVSELWRRKQLEYTWLRSLMGRHADFWHVTGESLDYALTAFKRQDPSLRALLMQQFLSLDCYGDVTAMLQRLREGGMKTAILSNGTPTMLAAAVEGANLGPLLDAVLSVDVLRAYKPRAEVYELVTARFNCVPGDVMFVSSNRWDVMGAASFGFRTIWVNRAGLPDEYPDSAGGVVARDLNGLGALA